MRPGKALYGKSGFGIAGRVWQGSFGLGPVRFVETWYGRHGPVRHVKVRHGPARMGRDMVWQAGLVQEWNGKAR